MSSRHFSDKRDRVRQLRIFCEVVRTESIAEASDHLDLSPPAVSLQVRELEHEIGALLLERRSTGVVPTPAGQRLHALSQPLIRNVDALFAGPMQAIETPESGRVGVATGNVGATFILPRYVKLFRERVPAGSVRLLSVPWDERLKLLLSGGVDLVCGAAAPFPEKAVRYAEMFSYDVVLIVPTDHPLAGQAQLTSQRLDNERAIIPAKGTPSRKFGEHATRTIGLEPDLALEVGGWSEVKRYVEDGLGIAVVPAQCLTESDRLSVLTLDAHFDEQGYGVYFPRNETLSPAARCFLELLVPDWAESPPPPARARTMTKRR